MTPYFTVWVKIKCSAKDSVYLVFAIDHNTLRFSLHLAESVVREIQKTKRSVIVLFLSSSCSVSQTIASDGTPLLAEPMFLLGWALCNTSTYCVLTFWLSCVNYALGGEFHHPIDSYKIFLHTHCFGYPELIFPLKTSFPIKLFRFLETNVCWNQSSYAMKVPLTLIIFVRRQQHSSLNENAFPYYQIHRHWSLTCSKTLHCGAS